MKTTEVYFLTIMIALAGAAVVAFVVYLSLRHGRLRLPGAAAGGDRPDGGAPPIVHPAPPATRLLGVLALLVSLLLLNWVWLPRNEQFEFLLKFIYPGVFGIFLVILFDKAVRTQSNKPGTETFREWLFIDLFVLLLAVSYVHLLRYQPVVAKDAEFYGSLFWDLLNLAGLFWIIWLVDRGPSRLRFAGALLYLMWLPILRLIWETVQVVERPEDQSWWNTIWPFFFLALIFLVLEVILLIATPRDSENQTPFLLKDAVFVVLYGVLLITAAR